MSNKEKAVEGHFTVGEKVLAFHGPIIYEATCLDIRTGNNEESEYYVHYQGWNKSWDEWVVSERLLKKTDDNLRRKKQVMEEHKQKTMNEKKCKTAVSSQRKRRREEGAESENEDTLVQEISIPIPNALQKLMVSDWVQVNRKHKLVPLPREPNVDSIFNEFLGSKTRNPNEEKEANEVVNGLRIYFERALVTRLLYKFERPQYDDAMTGSTKPVATVYGMEHLLRLFVVLPSLMAQTTLGKDQKPILVAKVSEFLKFLSKNQQWFSEDYSPMEPQYLEQLKQPAKSKAQS